jgi:hypothetical protein
MAFTGVYPVYKTKFKVDKGEGALVEIADMESFFVVNRRFS